MKIQIVDVAEGKNGAIEVTFSASCGVAIARWHSKSLRPQIGAKCDVELDISEIADRATNTACRELVSPALLISGETVLLRGEIEGVEEDGLAYLRMAPDCLVMIDTADGIHTGDAVQICVPSSAVSVTPTGI